MEITKVGLKIMSVADKYFLHYAHTFSYSDLINFLGLTTEEFNQILIKHSAIMEKDGSSTHYFKNKIDARHAAKELIPYIIMAKLTT